jgi:hypothetical protein
MLYHRWLSLASYASKSRRPLGRILGRLGSSLRWLLRRGGGGGGGGSAIAAEAIGRSHSRRRDRNESLPPWRLNTLGWIVALSVPLALAALGIGCGPSVAYLAGDRATYDAIAPEYAAYVDADPALNAPQRQRRHRTLESWRFRLEQAEQARTR